MAITSCISFSSFLLILSRTQVLADEPTVTLKFGDVRGSFMTTLRGRQLSAFRGIPYAKPPTGKLRFMPTEKWTEKWSTQPFDASQEPVVCSQPFINGTWDGQEDCLIVNVYTPEVPKDNANWKKLPVMVYIYGGFFLGGSTRHLVPSKILDYDVVLVTLNYRLNAFGFLSTGSKKLAGNYALFDQLEALRWVQENIQAFGGDPSKVTLLGESAGAACVSYHVLSKLSTGLFRAAVIMSGHTFNWAFNDNPKIVVDEIIKATDCEKEDEDEIITCLQSVPLEKLSKSISKAILSSLTTTKYILPFAPVLDGKFITDHPINLYQRGEIASKVPVMLGNAKEEGLVTKASIAAYVPPYIPLFSDVLLSLILAKLLSVDILDNVFQLGTAENLVKKRYFQSVETENQTLFAEKLMDMVDDLMMNAPAYYMVDLYVENGMTPYLFSLDYAFNHTMPNGITVTGASHADELIFLFRSPEQQKVEPNDENEAKFLDLWINFVIYRNPTPPLKNESLIKWEPVTKNQENIYHLDNPITFTPLEGGKSLVDFWYKVIPNSLKKG